MMQFGVAIAYLTALWQRSPVWSDFRASQTGSEQQLSSSHLAWRCSSSAL